MHFALLHLKSIKRQFPHPGFSKLANFIIQLLGLTNAAQSPAESCSDALPAPASQNGMCHETFSGRLA
jgi:hypothetical protein